MTIQTTSPGTLTMREAMYYTLSRPVSTVIVGCDSIAQLEENVQLAREFTPLSDAQTAAVVPRPRRRQACAVFQVLRAGVGSTGAMAATALSRISTDVSTTGKTAHFQPPLALRGQETPATDG